MTSIPIDETRFLTDFEQFVRVLVPLYNKARHEIGRDPLTDDEQTNLFLDLRKKYAITETREAAQSDR